MQSGRIARASPCDRKRLTNPSLAQRPGQHELAAEDSAIDSADNVVDLESGGPRLRQDDDHTIQA